MWNGTCKYLSTMEMCSYDGRIQDACPESCGVCDNVYAEYDYINQPTDLTFQGCTSREKNIIEVLTAKYIQEVSPLEKIQK